MSNASPGIPAKRHLVSEEQLLAALESTSMDERQLVRALLCTVPLGREGRASIWPALKSIRVRDLLQARVRVPLAPEDSYVSGFYAASLLVATAAAGPLVFEGTLPVSGYESSVEQLHVFYAVCAKLLGPVESSPVLELLTCKADDDGFFRGYCTYDIDTLETEIMAALQDEADEEGVVRIVDAVLEDGHRITAWRTGYAAKVADEKVYDISILQTDLEGGPRMYADLRVVCLPKGVTEQEAFWTLDVYGDEGLELGYGLKCRVRQGLDSCASLFNGAAIVQLQAFELRRNLQGQGLGTAALKAVMPLVLEGLPTAGHFVANVAPMQYDEPLEDGLPAEFLMTALDDRERLFRHLARADLTSNVPGMTGIPLQFLPRDTRASAPHYEQLRFLSEHIED